MDERIELTFFRSSSVPFCVPLVFGYWFMSYILALLSVVCSDYIYILIPVQYVPTQSNNCWRVERIRSTVDWQVQDPI